MGRKYSATNKIRFTSISENYQVQRSVKATLSELYSSVITYVTKHYDGTLAYKQTVVKVINILTYAAYASEMLPPNWSKLNPFVNIPDIDDDTIQDTIGDIYLTVDAIEWDVPVVDTTGAGDAYWGAFLSSLLEQGVRTTGDLSMEKLEKAGKYGAASGGLCVTKHGGIPALPYKEEITKVLNG